MANDTLSYLYVFSWSVSGHDPSTWIVCDNKPGTCEQRRTIKHSNGQAITSGHRPTKVHISQILLGCLKPNCLYLYLFALCYGRLFAPVAQFVSICFSANLNPPPSDPFQQHKCFFISYISDMMLVYKTFPKKNGMIIHYIHIPDICHFFYTSKIFGV